MEDFRWRSKYIFLLRLILLNYFYHTVSGNMEYKIYKIYKDWDSAKSFCLSKNFAGLAILDSQEKVNAFFALSDSDRSKDYWVGMVQSDRTNPRKETFVWESATASSWVNWLPNDPNFFDSQFCVRIRGRDKLFANKECSEAFYFACEPSDVPTTATSVAATVTTETTADISSGYYPVIHKDQNLQSSHPEFVVLVGSTRSEAECVTLCAKDVSCKYVIFQKSSKLCKAYSSSLKDQQYTLKTETGTSIRIKRVALK